VNVGNQLTADSNFGYQYDDNGNLIKKTLLATGNYTQYTYDAENRLTQVQEFAAGNPTAIMTSSYRYDGLGRRIEKVANGQTKRYVYDGEDIVLEYDGANVLQARYTHGPGIDEPIAVTKAGSTFYYHQDGLGTVTELTDINGAVAKAYAYDAYGNLLESRARWSSRIRTPEESSIQRQGSITTGRGTTTRGWGGSCRRIRLDSTVSILHCMHM
jgi:YD repeat-containing protein